MYEMYICYLCKMGDMIETHAHIYSSEYEEDLHDVIDRSKSVGIGKILMPNIDLESLEKMHKIEDRFPDYCYSMLGLHPCSVKQDFKEQLKELEYWLDKRKYVAIGEIGMDLYWDKTYKNQQEEAFVTQLSWAESFNLPIAVHSRNANAELIDILKNEKKADFNGVIHCFSGSEEEAKSFLDLGFYLGIGGVVTFKNAGLDKVVENLPLDRLLLETDAPYLSPVPFRGKRNEPSYIQYVASKLANLFSCSEEDVIKITTRNALNLFNWS